MIEAIKKLHRAANYLAVSQLYLRDNFLLERPLVLADIKPRLHGHWGSVPGITFLYAQLNALIKRTQASMMFLLGPGHGFPGLQAQLFIEGSLKEFYPEATHTYDGIGYISRLFSWPYGFPSHSNPGTPGAIVEGGELGYSLSTAYGAVLDNPDLIACCLVGDGEAETGPLAASWNLNKLLDPATNGAVLPVLHLNGYKISGPTISGRMSNRELKSLYYGLGYDPVIISGSGDKVYKDMHDALDDAYKKIRAIQANARNTASHGAVPRWPMIIMKTPKGWGGIKKIGDLKIEGNYASHQIVYADADQNKRGMRAIEKWMRTYHFEELFSKNDGFIREIKDIIPEDGLRMGMNRHTQGGKMLKPLILPSLENLEIKTKTASSMESMGQFLKEIFILNKSARNFRLMSPDETYSNKLEAVFDVEKRAWVGQSKPWDKDMAHNGRVMEILSEHALEGLMHGYVLTGRHAVFASYEAFIQVVVSMVDQYAKFLAASREFPWRGEISSLNFVLTSPGWRQDHNGYSHQNPGFVSNMLDKHHQFVRVYFPADANTTLAVTAECLRRRTAINIIVVGKPQEPQWHTLVQAREELAAGISIWDFASHDNPDIVICGTGDYLTLEALAAVDILRREVPSLRIRFVNILELTVLGIGEQKHPLSRDAFEKYFTEDKPVIFNFMEYPNTLRQAISGQRNPERFSVHGYIDRGSTTTPEDLHVRSRTSRWHLVIEALELMKARGGVPMLEADELIDVYQAKFAAHVEYVKRIGDDLDEIKNWKWSTS